MDSHTASAIRIAENKIKEPEHRAILESARGILGTPPKGVRQSLINGLGQAVARAGWNDIESYIDAIEGQASKKEFVGEDSDNTHLVRVPTQGHFDPGSEEHQLGNLPSQVTIRDIDEIPGANLDDE